MSERINISSSAHDIAAALLRAGKAGHVSRIDIDCVRAAVVGYLAAGAHILPKHSVEQLIEQSLRKLVEKVG